MNKSIKHKLEDIFVESVMLGHPGGVIRDQGKSSYFLPEPDHRSSLHMLKFVNDRLCKHDLRDIAATAFTMINGDASIMDGVYHCSSTSRSRKFMGATITLRWHDGSPDSDWSALMWTVQQPPLVD